jgi:hypothetical protein
MRIQYNTATAHSDAVDCKNMPTHSGTMLVSYKNTMQYGTTACVLGHATFLKYVRE